MLIADEVYQENIYLEGDKFYSFRKVLCDMGEPYRSSVELCSSHTVSKGLIGE
jgi:alanine transaminase